MLRSHPRTDGPHKMMSIDELNSFLRREFPQAFYDGGGLIIESAGPMHATCRLHYDDKHLRPGGTISGPSMFMLADATMYVAVLASIGPVALAVTTNMTINFLRKPAPNDLVAECTLFKLGKRLAVGEVSLASAGEEELVAHAVATYSIPPRE